MLTPRGLTLLALALLAWSLGRFLGVDELYVVSAFAAALLVLAIVSTRLSSARIAARRDAGTIHARLHEPATVEITLRNDGRLPASLLLVEDRRPPNLDGPSGARSARFVVPFLRPRQVVDLRSRVAGSRRGRYEVGPVRIRLRDPFGLAERTRRYRSSDELVVFPEIEPLGSGRGRSTRQGDEASGLRRAFHRGDEFYTMRSYVVGDDLRYVHWPSTAHRGTLMVRQHELPWHASAVVYVDTRRHVHRGAGDHGTFERTVSATASVLEHLRDERYDARLVADDRAPVDAVGDAALVRLAELAPAEPSVFAGATALVARTGGGLLVAVLRPPHGDSDLAEHPESRALLRAGAGYRTRVALVVAHDDRDDAARCATFARLLQVGGWHASAVAPTEPLAEPWHRAVVGAPADARIGVAG